MSAVTSPASTFCQLTSTTFAVFNIASAASIMPTRPRVSIMPSASPTSDFEDVLGSVGTADHLNPAVGGRNRDLPPRRRPFLPSFPRAERGDVRDVMA